jgi:hypothetical protein
MGASFLNNKNKTVKKIKTKNNYNTHIKQYNPHMNTSHNFYESNLEGLHEVNLNASNWNISPGNTHPEKIPMSLQFKPNVPKMKLPAFLQGRGRRTRRRGARKSSTKRIKRKN